MTTKKKKITDYNNKTAREEEVLHGANPVNEYATRARGISIYRAALVPFFAARRRHSALAARWQHCRAPPGGSTVTRRLTVIWQT